MNSCSSTGECAGPATSSAKPALQKKYLQVRHSMRVWVGTGVVAQGACSTLIPQLMHMMS